VHNVGRDVDSACITPRRETHRRAERVGL